MISEGRMPKRRSPEYPAIGLGNALEKTELVFAKDAQNRISKTVLALHLGYKSLSGASLPLLSALAKYGLIEGRGDDTRVSDLAVRIISGKSATAERFKNIQEAATKPELFAALDKQFPTGRVSEEAIRSFLHGRRFTASAADAAIRAYRETKDFVEGAIHERERWSETGPSPVEIPAIKLPRVQTRSGAMEGERELASGLLSDKTTFRLIVSGPVGTKELDYLIQKLQFDRRILAEAEVNGSAQRQMAAN
jgi:hypothetical protein